MVEALLTLVITFLITIISSEFPQPVRSFDWYSTCNTSFHCAPASMPAAVGFPFWGGERTQSCGLPELHLYCLRETTNIDIMGVAHKVKDINKNTQTFRISRPDFDDGFCGKWSMRNDTVLDPRLFQYAPGYDEFTLMYNCSEPITGGRKLNCGDGDIRYLARSNTGGHVKGSELCSSKVSLGFSVEDYERFSDNDAFWATIGFDVRYKFDTDGCDRCSISGGACGYDWYTNRTTCYCQNQTSWLSRSTCPNSLITAHPKIGQSPKRFHLSLGIATVVSGTIILCIAIKCYNKRKANFIRQKEAKFELEAFMRSCVSIAPKRYSYANVAKMTNSFSENIGQGGYGYVYKGKLQDNSLVAVKILKNSKGNGEEFVNEVASIGRTSHVNIVTLLGFCYEGTKRALIYEYMPNGSLDKFIFNKESNTSRCLEWKKLYEIAVGIAHGLEYLHRGCNTRILHLDIKPQNILLDKNLCPKISDFGLAKLWLRKESIVSMEGARGTIGYIAPEVFSPAYGGVSHKADVYSFGMLVLEMVGGRRNFDSGVSHTSEIYFPNRIYKDLEENEMSILGNKTEEEKEVSKKMILVSFWCIQTNPYDRPSMSKVVDMLEGSIESLEIPPKPYLFSPTRSPQQSSTTQSL